MNNFGTELGPAIFSRKLTPMKNERFESGYCDQYPATKRFLCINRSQNAKPAKDPAGGPAPHIKGRRPQPSPGRSDGSGTGGGPNSYPKTPSAAPKTTPKIVSAPVLPHPTNTPKDLLWRTTIEIRA